MDSGVAGAANPFGSFGTPGGAFGQTSTPTSPFGNQPSGDTLCTYDTCNDLCHDRDKTCPARTYLIMSWKAF